MPSLTSLLSNPRNSALMVGRDYPHPDGLAHVRRKWKEALRDPANCRLVDGASPGAARENEKTIRKAVGRGRYVVREMEGTIQLKKYRTMRRRYGEGVDVGGEASRIGRSLKDFLQQQ